MYYIVQIFCMRLRKADFIMFIVAQASDLAHVHLVTYIRTSCLLIHETLPDNRRFNLVYAISGYRRII